jgi:GNAT superfamily N-acetyltransferase
LVHTDADVRRWFAGVVLAEREVWLAEADGSGGVVGLMVLDGDWVDQLYVDPSWTGRGLGSRFVEQAKEVRPGGLDLWTFQSNVGAQRFYERHGFVALERTDGSGNEERSPDVRYAWRPATG